MILLVIYSKERDFNSKNSLNFIELIKIFILSFLPVLIIKQNIS